MDVSCATSANPMNILNNHRVKHHHHPEEATQHSLLIQHRHHQQQMGQCDDDTSSSHSETVMWEKYRHQPQNDNNKPPYYMVHDDLLTPSIQYPRHQSNYYYEGNDSSRVPSTASLSLIYNTNNNSLTSTNAREFLETVHSPLFIDSTGNRHQQTNVTTNKESLEQSYKNVSSWIKTEQTDMQREQSFVSGFDDNNSQQCTSTDGNITKKKDKKYVQYTLHDEKRACRTSNNCPNRDKAAVTTKQHSNDNNSQPDDKSPKVTERRRQRRESHNAVERRRRNNINDNIKLLGELLPENICHGKQNKGSILKGSVLYIRVLQDQLSRYKERVERLEYETIALQSGTQ